MCRAYEHAQQRQRDHNYLNQGDHEIQKEMEPYCLGHILFRSCLKGGITRDYLNSCLQISNGGVQI